LQHHPVFSRIEPFTGDVPAYYTVDYLGTIIRQEFIVGFGPVWPEPHRIENRYPEFDDEYFEWIDVCEAVVAAKESFTMIELGAGFGRWSVRAAHAMEKYHPGMPYRLIAVEAEPVVFGWMRQHFQDNGVDPDAHTLINAAVSDGWGRVQFYVGGPTGGPVEYKPGYWYGQALTKTHERPAKSKVEALYCGHPVQCHESGMKSIRVTSVSLRSLLKQLDRVDLIDIDIEGEEWPAVRGAIKILDKKVRRLHIATHEAQIEVDLRELLSAHGWQCLVDYPLFSERETPFGKMSFQDGVQTWVNPRLE